MFKVCTGARGFDARVNGTRSWEASRRLCDESVSLMDTASLVGGAPVQSNGVFVAVIPKSSGVSTSYRLGLGFEI